MVCGFCRRMPRDTFLQGRRSARRWRWLWLRGASWRCVSPFLCRHSCSRSRTQLCSQLCSQQVVVWRWAAALTAMYYVRVQAARRRREQLARRWSVLRVAVATVKQRPNAFPVPVPPSRGSSGRHGRGHLLSVLQGLSTAALPTATQFAVRRPTAAPADASGCWLRRWGPHRQRPRLSRPAAKQVLG
jgi:hypothetical protein